MYTLNIIKNEKQPYYKLLFAVRTGLEPATLGVTGRYSNQTELPHHFFNHHFNEFPFLKRCCKYILSFFSGNKKFIFLNNLINILIFNKLKLLFISLHVSDYSSPVVFRHSTGKQSVFLFRRYTNQHSKDSV